MISRIFIVLTFVILFIGWCEWSIASFMDEWKPEPVVAPECYKES